MPGKHIYEDPSGRNRLCKRCDTVESSLVVRSEPLCKQCFTKYVQTKVIKRMEGFRVRHMQEKEHRRLLLPVSFRASSITLLHILDQQLEAQISRTGRAGFELHVMYVNTEDHDQERDIEVSMQRIQNRYPRHHYSLKKLKENIDGMALPPLMNGLQHAGAEASHSGNTGSTPESLHSLTTASSRQDVQTSLRTQAIVKTAQELQCEAILWGDTTTKLAEKILAETAKGRGFSLPWIANDGESAYGVNFIYPMRDLLRKEVIAYSGLVYPALHELCNLTESKQTPVSAKNSTIDDLMKDYCESMDENYPSIIANVVRTAGKLTALPG